MKRTAQLFAALLVSLTVSQSFSEPVPQQAGPAKAEGAPATPVETPREKRIRERRNQQASPTPATPEPKAAPKAGARPIKEGNALEAKARTPEEQLKLFITIMAVMVNVSALNIILLTQLCMLMPAALLVELDQGKK